jgi:sugar phosphate isomerase/epimerase
VAIVADRILSLAAGVSTELETDPAAFVAATAAAGWPACGIWFDPATWTDATTRAVAARLADAGMIPLDIEVVRLGDERDCGPELVAAGAALGARNVLCISRLDDRSETVARYAALCELAAPAGIRVCLEFMRFTSVPSLEAALEVVQDAAQPNGGVLVDTLHLFRSGGTLNDLATVDPGLLPYAQWCDAPAEPSGWSTRELIDDALHDRLPPGQGALPVDDFVTSLAPGTPLSLEVRSRWLRETYPDHIERAKAVLAAAQAHDKE